MSAVTRTLLILLLGTAIAGGFPLDQAFWKKIEALKTRKSRMVGDRIRVSDFEETA